MKNRLSTRRLIVAAIVASFGLQISLQGQTNTFPASGNVGIGTTTPGAGLEINKGAANSYALLLNSSGAGWGSGVLFYNSGGGNRQYGIYVDNSAANAWHFADNSAGSDRLLITSTGYVGIGTTTPAAKLDVAGGSLLAEQMLYVRHIEGKNWNDQSTVGDLYLQYTNNSSNIIFNNGKMALIGATGNLGIGTTNPTAALQVGTTTGNQGLKVGIVGNMANSNAEIRNNLAVLGDSAASISSVGATAWNYYNAGNSPSWAGSLLEFFGSAYAGNAYGLPGANQGTLLFQNVSNGVIASNGAPISISPAGYLTATFTAAGNVGIGTTNPTQKLSVNGAIRAKEVIVDTGWSDYVFRPDYRLASLSEVEGAIQKEGHLPGIPSASEVAEHGISVGDMQAKLLAKIEELTLHVIAQEKQHAELVAEVRRLDSDNRHLRDLVTHAR